MADTDVIRVQHNVTNGVFETTRRQYEEVWQAKGWTEVAPDTPLTDYRYQPDGGGEPQPAPSPQPSTEGDDGRAMVQGGQPAQPPTE